LVHSRRDISEQTAALVARAGVRCAASARALERSISEQSGKFQQS